MGKQNVKKTLAVADRGYVMERGMLVASGPAALLTRSSVIREACLGAAAAGKKGSLGALEAARPRASPTTA